MTAIPKLLSPCGPVDRLRITSDFGSREVDPTGVVRPGHEFFHPGWDLRTSWVGTNYADRDGLIYAPEDMRIIRSIETGYRIIEAQGASGLFYRFGHVAALMDAKECKAGEPFAKHGPFGTNQLHLHFEIHEKFDPSALRKESRIGRGNPVDPKIYYKGFPLIGPTLAVIGEIGA